MNPLRAFLLRRCLTSRCLFFVIFTVMMSRALLSSAVMLDPDAQPGSYGVVMCSGYGPMFSGNGAGMDAKSMDMSMPGMDMSMGHANMPHAHHTDAGGDRNSSNICPFSAALIVGIWATMVTMLLFGVLTARRYRLNSFTIPLCKLVAYLHPPSQAPPSLI